MVAAAVARTCARVLAVAAAAGCLALAATPAAPDPHPVVVAHVDIESKV